MYERLETPDRLTGVNLSLIFLDLCLKILNLNSKLWKKKHESELTLNLNQCITRTQNLTRGPDQLPQTLLITFMDESSKEER